MQYFQWKVVRFAFLLGVIWYPSCISAQTASGLSINALSDHSPSELPRSKARSSNLYYQYITDANRYETLQRIGLQYSLDYDEQYIAPFGLVESDSGRLFYNFYPEETEVYKEAIANIDLALFVEDWQFGFYADYYLTEIDSLRAYLLNLDIGIEYFEYNFKADYVRFDDLVAADTNLHLIGAYSGTLRMDGDTLAEATDTMVFSITFDGSGQVSGFHQIEGMRGSERMLTTRSVGGMYLAGRADSGLYVDGQAQHHLAGSWAILSLDNLGRMEFVTSITQAGAEMLDIARSGAGEFMVSWLANAQGSGQPLALHRYNHSGQLINERSFLIPGLEPTQYDLDYVFHAHNQSFRDVVVGITFSGSVELDSVTFTSVGGTDVMILRMDHDFEMLNKYHYGSRFDENVSFVGSTYVRSLDCFYHFFGGEFSSKHYRRRLGDIEFINSKRGIQKAYITYIHDQGPDIYRPLNVGPLTAELPTTRPLPGHLQLSPNPAVDEISLRYENVLASSAIVEITDLDGSVLYQKKYTMDSGQLQASMSVDHLLPAAYFIRVVDDQGVARSRKLVKVP